MKQETTKASIVSKKDFGNDDDHLVKVNPNSKEFKQPIGTNWESLAREESNDPIMKQFIDEKFKPSEFWQKLPS